MKSAERVGDGGARSRGLGSGIRVEVRIVRMVSAGKETEPAAALLERKQLWVADAQQWTAERGHERQHILWIGQRAKQHNKRFDLLRLAEGTGAADLDRNVQGLERMRVWDDAVALLSGQDEEIAETFGGSRRLSDLM